MKHARAIVSIAAAGTLTLIPTVAAAQTPTQTPPVDPPSVAQLCAATSVGAVDAYLAAVAEAQLVGGLAPLVDLTVPRTGGGLAVEADVTLAQVRDALDCGEPTPTTTPAPTTTAGPEPTDDPDPTTTPVPDDDKDNGGRGCCPQVDVVPDGGVDTGDGTTSILP